MTKLQQSLVAYVAVASTAALVVACLALSGIAGVYTAQPKALPSGCVQGYVPAQVNGKPVLLPVVLCQSNGKTA